MADCADFADEHSSECPECEENQFRCDAHQLSKEPTCVARYPILVGASQDLVLIFHLQIPHL